jgi:hypothetical protein
MQSFWADTQHQHLRSRLTHLPLPLLLTLSLLLHLPLLLPLLLLLPPDLAACQ